MRHSIRILLPALALLTTTCSGSTPSGQPTPMQTTRTLVILHTTDEHSHLLGFAPESDDYPPPAIAGTGAVRGGIARRMTILAAERARARDGGAASLTVSAGDSVMGTLASEVMTTRAPDWIAMKALGYDATTFGNHAFDYGPAALATSLGVAQAAGGAVPTVMSNVRFSDADPRDDALAALFDEGGGDATKPIHRALVVTASNGLRVGLVGIMGASAASYAAGKAPVSFSVPAGGTESDHAAVLSQIVADVQPLVDRLRGTDHVDLVVALSHAGLDASTATVGGEDLALAKRISGIDVFVSGHTHQVVPLTVATNTTGAKVWLQQAGQYGEYVGRIVVKVDPNGVVSVDGAGSAILDVDDRTLPDPRVAPIVDDTIRALESDRGTSATSFLERTLSRIEGTSVVDDPARLGDLYFRALGHTTFDVPGIALRKEMPLVVLSADAMLAAADASTTERTDLAVVAQGLVFGDLAKGRTGALAFSDVARALPLGASPADGSPGFPLVRFGIWLAEIKAAFELSAGYAFTSVDAGDYFLVPAGIRYEFDTSRPTFDPAGDPLDPQNGRVTKICIAEDHASIDVCTRTLFDVGAGGWKTPPTRTFAVTTSLYVASFAASVGVTLRTPDGASVLASPVDAILRRTDGSEVKDWEALGTYVRAVSMANGGTLPSRYDASILGNFPRRAICSGPLCAGVPPTSRTR